MAHLTTFLSRRFRAQSRGPLSSPFKKRRVFAAIADFKPLFDNLFLIRTMAYIFSHCLGFYIGQLGVVSFLEKECKTTVRLSLRKDDKYGLTRNQSGLAFACADWLVWLAAGKERLSCCCWPGTKWLFDKDDNFYTRCFVQNWETNDIETEEATLHSYRQWTCSISVKPSSSVSRLAFHGRLIVSLWGISF